MKEELLIFNLGSKIYPVDKSVLKDPTGRPYPYINEEPKGFVVIQNDTEYFDSLRRGGKFYSELPPEGWTAKNEFPRKMLVWFDESYKVREVFGKTLDHWYYTDPSTPGAVYATKKVKEIDHEQEQKLKRLEELKQEVESLENELGI